MSDAIGISGSGSSSTPPVFSTTPGAPSVLAVSVIDTTPDANGNPQKQITVTYAPPSPLGSFAGVWVYLDAPDSAGGLSIADGTLPADGTTPAMGAFQPTSEGFFPYNPANFQIVFVVAAPNVAQLWRVYLLPGSSGAQSFPIQYGQPGASPSQQFLVEPPATAGSGVEYAPLIANVALTTPTGWPSNPAITIASSGDQYWQVNITWTWPTSSVDFSKLAGVNLILDNNKGTQTYLGDVVVSANPLYTSAAHLFAVPPGTTIFTIWFLSFNQSGVSNTLVPGVTPSVQFTVTRSSGPVGEEYCALVLPDANADPFVTAIGVSAADGTQQEEVTAQWSNPSDPQFGGAEIVVLKPDGKYYSVGAGTLSPIQDFIPPAVGLQNWAFFLRSLDINERRNSVTPAIVFAGGSGSGAVFAPVVVGGVLTSCVQLAGGSYSGTPTATLVDATGAAIPGVSLTCNMSGALVGTITVNTGGSGIVATPLNVIAVGSNSGLLNLAQSNSATFSAQFSIVAGAFTVSAINAGIITTGQLKVGNNGSGFPIELEVFDHLGSLIGWVGDDTGSSGFVGGWMKQFRIGGASPSAAPFVADSSGNISMPASALTAGTITATISITAATITGSTVVLNKNGLTTSLNNSVSSQGGFFGYQTDDATNYAEIGPTYFVLARDPQSSYSPVVVITTGGTTSGEIDLYSGGTLEIQIKAIAQQIKIAGNQVLTSRQTDPGAPSFSVLSDAQTWCANLRTALRNHGLI